MQVIDLDLCISVLSFEALDILPHIPQSYRVNGRHLHRYLHRSAAPACLRTSAHAVRPRGHAYDQVHGTGHAAVAGNGLRPAAAQRPECPAPPARALRRAPRDRSAPPGAAIRTGAAVFLYLPKSTPFDHAPRPSVIFHASAYASLAHHLFTSPPRPRGGGPEGVTFSWNS